MSHAAAAVTAAPASNPSAGGRLVAADGRALPLTGTRLTAHAAGGLCRTVLEQRFHNPHAEPLRVTYTFPLPHDGAVSGFAFTLGDRRVVGEVDRLKAARERFERALVEGKTAGLVEQVRGSVFTQELGNVPPGAEVTAELTIDQRLAWLPEGAWEWRFPTAVAPRYHGAPGRTPDAGRLSVDVAEHGVPVRLNLTLAVADPLAAGGALTSPTHALRVDGAPGALRAALSAPGGVPLDRDVAIRWPVATPSVGATLRGTLAPAASRLAGRAFGLLSLVPPTPEARRAVPRDLIVLLDTSGSMSGEPLDQAREVVNALVDSLGDADRLELIEFSDEPRRWKAGPVAATGKARAEARRWLAGLSASGCTEMGEALLEALRPLRDEAQRQVILVTDGQIGFEHEIMATLLGKLPPASRLHAVAVGDAVNRSLTGPAARAGRGVEVVVGLDEPASAAAARLLARTVAPVVTGLTLSGPALRGAVAHAPDLYGGAPALLPVELAPEGGALTVRGRTADGEWTETLQVSPAAAASVGGALAALFGREQVEALEAERTISADEAAVDAQIEALGLAFQLSTRRTSWVAVSDDATVDPRQPTRRQTMPQALPHGMSVAGMGLRAGTAMHLTQVVACMAMPSAAFLQRDLEAQDITESASGAAMELEDEGPPPPRSPSSRGPARKSAMKKDEARSGEPRMERAMAPPKGAAAPRPLRTLRARVVRVHHQTLWVLEVDVPSGGLDWQPGETVLVSTPRGEREARVEASMTTVAGPATEGQVLRLVLHWSGGDLGQVTLADGTVIEVDAP